MQSSCTTHPKNHKLLIIREWQIKFCDGNHCAAALLSYFEYWHNIKLNIIQKNKKTNDLAESYGEMRTQDESLLQFHTVEEISEGLLNLYGRNLISQGINLLVDKKVLSVTSNPNPRYSFDKTRYFNFYPEVCNEWIHENYSQKNIDYPILNDQCLKREIDQPKINDREFKKGLPSFKKGQYNKITNKINNNLINTDHVNGNELNLNNTNSNHDLSKNLADNCSSQLRMAKELLLNLGMPPEKLQNSNDLLFLQALIDQIKSAKGSPLEMLQKVFQKALRSRPKEKITIQYLKPIVSQNLTNSSSLKPDGDKAIAPSMNEFLKKIKKTGHYTSSSCLSLFDANNSNEILE